MATEPKTLEDLLKHGLKDMYYAEGKIQKALPKMIKAAQDEELKAGLEKHLEETAEQISKLEALAALRSRHRDPLRGHCGPAALHPGQCRAGRLALADSALPPNRQRSCLRQRFLQR